MGLTVIAGILFGTVYGTIYVVIGGAGSTLIGFYFARWLERDFIERITKNKKVFYFISPLSLGFIVSLLIILITGAIPYVIK